MCVKLVTYFSNFVIFLTVLCCVLRFTIKKITKFKKCRASKKIFIFGKFYVMNTVVCGTNRNNTIKKIIKFEKYEDNFAHVRLPSLGMLMPMSLVNNV